MASTQLEGETVKWNDKGSVYLQTEIEYTNAHTKIYFLANFTNFGLL